MGLTDEVIDAISRGLETSPDALKSVFIAKGNTYQALASNSEDPMDKTYFLVEADRWHQCAQEASGQGERPHVVAYCVEMSRKTLSQAAEELRNFPPGSESYEPDGSNARPALLSNNQVDQKTFYQGSWYMYTVSDGQMSANQAAYTENWRAMAKKFTQ